MLPLLKRTLAIQSNATYYLALDIIAPVCTISTYSGFGYCCTDKSDMYRYWILFDSASQDQIDNAIITMWDWKFLLKDKKRLPGIKGLLCSLYNILS